MFDVYLVLMYEQSIISFEWFEPLRYTLILYERIRGVTWLSSRTVQHLRIRARLSICTTIEDNSTTDHLYTQDGHYPRHWA